MSKRIASPVVMAAFVSAGTGVWADDTNATGNNNAPLSHPINAYTNHEVKEDMKDSQENSQKAAEAKATYEQAKADYEKSIKDNGAKSDITIASKKRMREAHKDLRKYSQKTANANQELKKDEVKAQQ
jgi:hypothetical protein